MQTPLFVIDFGPPEDITWMQALYEMMLYVPQSKRANIIDEICQSRALRYMVDTQQEALFARTYLERMLEARTQMYKESMRALGAYEGPLEYIVIDQTFTTGPL